MQRLCQLPRECGFCCVSIQLLPKHSSADHCGPLSVCRGLCLYCYCCNSRCNCAVAYRVRNVTRASAAANGMAFSMNELLVWSICLFVRMRAGAVAFQSPSVCGGSFSASPNGELDFGAPHDGHVCAQTASSHSSQPSTICCASLCFCLFRVSQSLRSV